RGDRQVQREMIESVRALDEKLNEFDAEKLGVREFTERLRELGQRRSTLYEPMIAAHNVGGKYGRAFNAYSTLRPDLIFGEYEPCAIADTKGSADAITKAIARKAHTVEFTCFMQEGLAGLDKYLREKIANYARMLESL
ncbi:MAG: hypothetical protein KC457_26505, partial [Myxococcales bacterium]|nr:hypothetical protein [Myxococcales bacterium]